MVKLLTDAEDKQLIELWSRRSSLAGKELETLCKLVMRLLQRCSAPELLSLREGEDLRDTRERYIHDFLLAKVLDTERYSDQSRLDSPGALVGWFRNMLLNAIDSKKESILRDSADLDHERFRATDDSIDSPESDATTCMCAAESASNAFRWLHQAREFARNLEARYQVLLLSYCADEAVFSIAKRYNIASAAHHAGKLGITKKHGDAPSAYDKTLIGNWLINELKLPLDQLHLPDVMEAFDALCAASFELREMLEARLEHA